MGKSKNQKRLGNVVTLRINPKTCMSVVDVLTTAEIKMEGMSFAMMVSLALDSTMQTLRDAKLIPEREGWEYLQLVGPHVGQTDAKKLQVTNTLKALGSELHVKGISVPAEEPSKGYVEPELTAEQRRIWSRLGELEAKKELAETEDSGVVWQNSDQQEYDQLNRLV
jgi:hypothetical protein